MTEEEVEAFLHNVEKMDKCWSYGMEIAGVLLRNMSQQVSGLILQNLVPKYAKILTTIDDEKKDYELIPALCFLDDCIEYGDDGIFQVVSGQAATKLIEVLYKRGAESQDLTQNCIYGLGALAKRTTVENF